MSEGMTGNRALYIRCPSCEAGGLRPDCEECGGAGFVPTGLTLDMLTQIAGQVRELAHIKMSIVRRSGQERNGH
jgi:hypothetical protein